MEHEKYTSPQHCCVHFRGREGGREGGRDFMHMTSYFNVMFAYKYVLTRNVHTHTCTPVSIAPVKLPRSTNTQLLD